MATINYKEINAIVNKEEAWRTIDEQDWTTKKKGMARFYWRQKHEPDEIQRKPQNKTKPKQVNLNMSVEEFRKLKEDQEKEQRIKRREIIKKMKQLQDQLDEINKNLPVREGECYCCLEETEEELNCGHLFCDNCRGDDLIVNCGLCKKQTEYEG